VANDFQVPRGLPIRPTTRVGSNLQTTQVQKPKTNEFQRILEQKLGRGEVKFSAHAEKRLQSSGITLSQEQLNALENAVNKASNKGARESLILMGDLAFVVSVKNRTVITAIDGDRIRENVFTNIDSAVIT
jgi:flagellar operon protein